MRKNVLFLIETFKKCYLIFFFLRDLMLHLSKRKRREKEKRGRKRRHDAILLGPNNFTAIFLVLIKVTILFSFSFLDTSAFIIEELPDSSHLFIANIYFLFVSLCFAFFPSSSISF